jgi:predicted transcriptional regulator
MSMARREVLVQLDDDLVARLDELAAQLGTNRSELLRRGAAAVINAEELATADRENLWTGPAGTLPGCASGS